MTTGWQKDVASLLADLPATEVQETLRAIVLGEVDALVVDGDSGPAVYTLKDANHPYRLIIEKMSEGAVVADADGTVLYCNRRFADFVGADKNALLGRPLQALVAPDQRARVTGILALASSGPAAAEMDLVSKQGMLPVYLSASPIEIEDWASCIALVVTDLSSRKRSEQLAAQEAFVRKILDQALEPIIVCDTAGIVSHASLAAQTLCVSSPIGRHFDCSFPLHQPAGAAGERQHASQPAADGQNVYGVECEMTCRDGVVRHFLLREGPLKNARNQTIGRIVTLFDITERKYAERALIAAKQEAECANNAKSRFLAAASHDLRQPLAALSMYIGVLRSRLGTEGAPLFNNMKNCLANLNELLGDLLDVSKLDAGVVTPSISDFSIGQLLGRIISAHAPEAQLKGLRLRCGTHSELIVRTDPVLFSRLLGNLISNAIRYTDSGGVLVKCRRQRGKMWVEVWDTGIGIPGDKTVEIFDEFKQLGDGARNRGSGLGLAIVAKTATLLGLEIRVASRLGRGSLFAVELPLGAVVDPAACMQAQARPLRIGLVEDNVEVATALVYSLTAFGHQVIAAASGNDLLERLGRIAPDIVVSDYRLAGGETGFNVITAIRAAFGSELPAFIVTGDTDPRLMSSMATQGVMVLHKPLELDALQIYLAELTGGT
jgi:PAS domain S-box-containing protein